MTLINKENLNTHKNTLEAQIDILKSMEKERNVKYDFDIGYREEELKLCNHFLNGNITESIFIQEFKKFSERSIF